MNQKQKDTIREEFMKEFNWLNGVEAMGVIIKLDKIADYWLSKLDQAYQQGAKDKVEEILKLKGNFWEDEDHIVGGYISKKELKALLLKDNT